MSKTISRVDDDGSFQDKYALKKFNAEKSGLPFGLSQVQLARLMLKAGIVSSQWSKGVYDLSRIGDRGGYTVDNCRFLTHGDNIRERNLSVATRTRLSQIAKLNIKKKTGFGTPYWNDPDYYREIFQEAGKRGGKALGEVRQEAIRSEVRGLLTRKIPKSVAYPDFGWKSRLSKFWGVTKRRLDKMLELEPEIVKTLSRI